MKYFFCMQLYFNSNFIFILIYNEANCCWENQKTTFFNERTMIVLFLFSLVFYCTKCVVNASRNTSDIFWEWTNYKRNTYPAPPKTSVTSDISCGKTVMTRLKEKKWQHHFFFLIIRWLFSYQKLPKTSLFTDIKKN